ncbi:MAG: hypothetical protein RL685_4672 [Pseudomonadota bacterium]|jgi:hypothetical protein
MSRRRSRIPTIVPASALALLVLAEPTAASELSWSGPRDCDQREQLLFQVERALSAQLSQVAEFQFQVHVERTKPDARARLLVRTSAESGVSERVLMAPSCSKLVDTLAVAMALAVEAAASSEPTPSSSSTAIAAPETPALPATPSTLPNDEPPEAPDTDGDEAAPLVWRAAFWLAGDSGSLPAPGLGAALGIELAWPRLQLRALATLWLEQHTRLAAQPGLGGDLGLVTGALLGCTRPFGAPSDPLALGLCAGGELGRLSGIGTGVLDPREGQSLWAAARAEADLFWSVPGTQLRLGAQLSVAAPFIRDDFVLETIGPVHRPGSLVGRAGLGIDVAFE